MSNDQLLALGHDGSVTVVYRFFNPLDYNQVQLIYTSYTAMMYRMKTCKVNTTLYRFAIYKMGCVI